MKTVLITGASRGIGSSCAEEFAKNNYHVIINYNKSKESAEEIAKKTGGILVKADISKADEVLKMRDFLSSQGIHPDCIVNNAGISSDCLFSDISEDEWDRIFNINVRGTFLVTKAFLPHMISKKSGSIVNIGSIWGETGASMEVAYSASKAALIGMTKSLAKELAPSSIRVNCVCPGYIDTDMNKKYTSEDISDITDEIPLGRIGVPHEIAKVVEFLASDKASYITGQIIGANGGWLI